MDLSTLITVLLRRKWTIVATVVVTVLLTGLGILIVDERYEASTTLRLGTVVSGSLTAVDYEVEYADRLMNTYSEIATSTPVLDAIRVQFGLEEPPDVEVEIMANTELMRINVRDGDPELASGFANTLAGRLIDQVDLAITSGEATSRALTDELTQLADGLSAAREEYDAVASQFAPDSPQVTVAARSLELAQDRYSTLLLQVRTRDAIQATSLSIVEPADVPVSPASPRAKLLLALGTAAGLIAGVGLSFLEENLDTTVHTEAEVEKLTEDTAPILGVIPRLRGPALRRLSTRGSAYAWFRRSQRTTLVSEHGVTSSFDQSFRRLRAAISAVDTKKELGSILVVSAEADAGKSTIASNLAHSFAHAGKRVVVVDCNARAPSLDAIFQVPDEAGLFDLLEVDGDWPKMIQQTDIPGLDVITAGQNMSSATDLLGSLALESLVKWLKQEYDVVLLDSAALLAAADAVVLASLADGLLFVASLGMTRREALEGGLRQLERIKGSIVGVVVNRDSSVRVE